jgi:hypothetical protein
MARTSTMSTTGPAPRRTVIDLDAGSPCEDRVLVLACRGTGPYTLTVRPVHRWDRLRWWLRALWRRLVQPITKPVADWWWSRCDQPWCWREEIDGYCLRHIGLLDGDG